jgi:hypothetical protein
MAADGPLHTAGGFQRQHSSRKGSLLTLIRSQQLAKRFLSRCCQYMLSDTLQPCSLQGVVVRWADRSATKVVGSGPHGYCMEVSE